MAASKKRKFIRYFLLIFWVSIFGWQFYQMNASGFDEAIILSSNDRIIFKDTDEYISFYPKSNQSNISILFFPGALVQPKAYAPLAQNLAHQGYSIHIQKIPFRIAITDNMEDEALEKAINFMSSTTNKKWIVAGHSRGGRMASTFASKYPELLSGMILLGTSHPKENDLTQLDIPILKISASEDGLASPSEVEQFAKNLPISTEFVMIDGGNHSQFGYYGFQFGAGSASLTQEEQQEITQKVIIDFLNSN